MPALVRFVATRELTIDKLESSIAKEEQSTKKDETCANLLPHSTQEGRAFDKNDEMLCKVGLPLPSGKVERFFKSIETRCALE